MVVRVVDFAPKESAGRADMLKLLTTVTERVHSGEVIGLVMLQTTEGSITYNSAAGQCCSHNMLGLLHGTAVQIANVINDKAEDMEG